jgi:hypothetical protein
LYLLALTLFRQSSNGQTFPQTRIERSVIVSPQFAILLNCSKHYLGHSINAPTGRWQKNKDVHWYSRDSNDDEEGRREEIRKVKEAEAEALSVALCVSITLLYTDADTLQGICAISQTLNFRRRGIIAIQRRAGRSPARFREGRKEATKS